MKKNLLAFGEHSISKAQMKQFTGGQCPITCEYTLRYGNDFITVSGGCSGSNPDQCTWMIDSAGADEMTYINCYWS